jgi:Carboxypeptidase regulatory-like domain/TonB dependent receptor
MVMGHGRGWLGWFAAVLAWVCAPVVWSQSGTDGAIGGKVLTAAGAPVRGATVEVRGLETGLTMRAVSGAHGEFLVVRLPVGEYAVSVEAAGAEATVSGPVAVGLGEVTEIEFRLQTAAGHASTASGSERTLTDGEIAALPVNGGDWRSLAQTVAGANDAAGPDGDAGEVSFRGVGVAQNSMRIDGTSGDDNFSGGRMGAGVVEDGEVGSDVVYDRSAGVGSGASSVADGGQRAGSAYAFSQAGVREFRVQGQGGAAAYGSALYGHGVGGVVTTVSRAGGTTLHGMAFYTVRDSAWAAVNPFAVASNFTDGVVTSALVKPEDLRQQFGGSVGGPVALRGDRGSARMNTDQRRRLFFFYAFDAQRRNFPAISAPGYAGFYSLTATQTALLANRGVTPAKTLAALNYLDSLTGTLPRSANQAVNFGRLDWQRSGRSRVALEYNRVRWSGPGAARTGAVVDRGLASIGSSYGRVDAGIVRWVQFWRGGLSNEVRAQAGRELLYETAQTPLAQEPNIGPGGMPPEVSIGPQGLVFGTPAALGQKAYPDERRFEVADVLAWVRGRQFVQFGGDFSALSDFTDSLTNFAGTFSYDSGVTNGKAGGLVDWITDYTFNVNAYPNGGCPSITAEVHDFCFRSYSQSFGERSLSFGTQEWAAFAQDDWRVGPRLTLHAGVRYEYEFLPLPQQPNAGLDAVFGTAGATSVFPEDRNNFGPRLGAEWAPFGLGRGVVRLGYGVYFGKLPGLTIRAALLDTALPSSVTQVRILPKTETACPQKTTVGFGYACSYLAAPGGAVAATTSAMVFDRRFRLPMVQQGTVSLERELGRGVLGSASYDLNIDRQLPNSVDINIAPATGVKGFQLQGGTGAVGARDGETFAIPVYTARMSASFGPVTDVVSNANASYNALTLEARRGAGSGRSGYRGAGRGLEFRAAWTWSKAIDFGQNPGAVPRANGQFDPFDVRYDKGLSALNFPHRVVATVIWLPRITAASSGAAATAERAIWRLLDGWSLAGIFTEASGRGYSYEVFGGTRLAGGRESINGSGGSTVLPTAGRNTLRLPDSMNLDLRLSRSFRLGETLRLRGAVEAFNVTNHVNYSGVTQRAFLVGIPANGATPLVFQDAAAVASEGLNVLPFGAYTAAGTNQARERQIQVGLRLEF